ncbi:MAG: domain protein putative component of TonB system [Labilithrix sp.]|nr:domain protein putative component of TonB system [Labilithrix sp.]
MRDWRHEPQMTASTIRNALGILQDEPDDEQAWESLRAALKYSADVGTVDPGELGAGELATLLEAARQAHEMRREYEAVAELLEIEVALARSTDPVREAGLVHTLAVVLDDILHDDAGAVTAWKRLRQLQPDEPTAEEAIERAEAKRAKWKDLAQRYFTESKSAGDASFKSSLLVSAAEIAYRYGRPELEAAKAKLEAERLSDSPPKSIRGGGKPKKKKAKDPEESKKALFEKSLGLLREALTLDPKNRRAVLLQERLLRDEERWEELATALDTFATESTAKDEKIAALVRLARVYTKKLGSKERAVAVHERVLDLSPGHPEATNALVTHFTDNAMWDHLVSLYEGQLSGGGVRAGQEVGVILQIAMVNWRMRDKPEAAEPYFERLRKHEPAHPGMLAFFRAWCPPRSEGARLAQILSDAQRAMPEGPQRSALAAEIAGLAEEGANAQKAIEQWRTVLRSEPANVAARDALKRLYRQTGAYNHLADLLRTELERVAPDDAAGRLPALREIAALYREHIKSDSALVTLLSQIIALDPRDSAAVRELAGVYESLGRWRDLLTTQMRLAELEEVPSTKAELYRAIARRWLDQFSNVQNAVEAYEKLREVEPEDAEALAKLKELYTKRRAYRQLYDILDAEARRTEGPARRALWMEMARMASERLDRGGDAVRLFKQILSEDPADLAALDALEKQAERDKDWATVAEALERRAELAPDAASKLAVLQKLGSVFSDRLQEPNGALHVWRRVLELSPGHPKALRILRDSYLAIGDHDGLTDLYAASSDWEGLAEVLSGAADRAIDVAQKVDLSYRAATIFETHLSSPDRAFRAYERVLSVRPDDRRAAQALVPLYEQEEKWTRLPALYETLLAHAGSDEEKHAFYRKLATVTGQRLGDRAAAFGHAVKAYALAPTEPGAVAELEEQARAAGDWTGFAQALEARARDEQAGPDEKRALRLKLAEVAATHTGQTDEAIAGYRELILTNEEDEEAIAALDRLLRAGAERHEDLRWLFRLRVRRAPSPDAQIALLTEWALLEEEALSSPAAAIALYREILDLDAQHVAALRALARLLLASGDAEGAARALEQERDLEQGDSRVAREIELARLYMGPLKKPLEALAAARRALEIAPGDPQVIGVIEELLPLAETRSRAAVTLEEAYASSGAWQKQGEVLGVLIATAPSKADRLALHQRLADVKQKLGDHAGAFDVVARAAQDNPAELEIWDRLSVLANKTGRTQRFVEAIAQSVPERGETGLPVDVELDLAERAATLYDEMLGDIDKATPYLERILARDPSNDRAFARLKQILTTRERWQELEALYERVVEATADAGRRADLLNEVAIIAEEITGEQQKAIQYYERILELEPGHDQAIFALDKLYANAERWQSLADLLVRRLELGAADPIALKLRLGTLLMNRLGDPKAALNHLEEVVSADSSIVEARDLVEKCLAHPDLRQRAAIILEGVYAEREEMRDLVRVLEVRLEFVTDDVERRDLLRRIAELRDERLSDDPAAFDAYARLLPLAPGDVEARTRFLEIAQRLTRQDEAAEVVLVAAKNADSPQPRADLLFEVARIYEAGDQPDRAEAIYRQAMDLAPDDPAIALPAVRSLERNYRDRGKYSDLADVLRVRVKLEDSVPLRRKIYAQLGVLAEEQLKDDPAAIVAWRARLEDDPADDLALAALDRLYARTADHRNLVEVLRSREGQATTPEMRKALMVRTAETLAGHLDDTNEAILAYRAVLDDFGADREILAALARLHEKAEQWPDLAETLQAELALANDDASRIALLTKLGDVRRRRLSETSEAIDAYREALALSGSHVPAREALEELLDDESARREAAEILRPLYEAGGEHARLMRVLDIQVEHEASLAGRLDVYERAAEVTEGPLADPQRAFGYAARALRESAGDPAVTAWIKRAEALTERTGSWADLVQLYRDVIPDVLDEEQQLGLLLRVAQIARGKLADAQLAKEHYKKALELRAEDASALVALEELHEEAGEQEDLIGILKRRTELAESDDDKRALLYKQARVADEQLGDRDRAAAVYEQVLELGLDAPAIAALERLYTAAGRWGDLIALHERELGRDGTLQARRADLHHALGNVHERELGELERAFDEYAEALREDPAHAATVASLERLMAQKATSGRAAEMLEQVYLARMDWRNVMAAVQARLDSSEDPDERRTLLRRLAQLHEEQEENYAAALEVTAKLLAEDVTDEATWAELERLARVANAEERLAQIYAAELDKVTSDEPSTARLAFRTGELFEAQKEPARALLFYRRAYAFAPEDEQAAFGAIDRLLEQSARPAERVALYRDALEYRSSGESRLATLHAIARIEEEELSDDDAAIATYRSVLEVDETDARALDALVVLFTRRERFRDLADILRRRAEQSALPDEEARWRLALGKVLADKLGEPAASIDELELVLGLVSPIASDTGRTAVAALEAMLDSEDHRGRAVELLRPIYEQADDWQKLVDLSRHRLALAATPGERVAVLRENARLLEERGSDTDKAFDALKEAFVLDPDDGDTREELDRVAVAGARWDDLADAYEQGITKIDGIGQRELLEALARLHDTRRDDPRHALDAWDRLFRLDESDPRPLDEMDQLATLLSDWPTLVRVLAKRAELTNDDEERASLWRRIGEARRDMLEDPQGAIDAYERALELEPSSAFTLDNIIALYEERNDAARLVDLYRRRVELCGDDDQELKHQLLLDAARCYEVGLNDRREAVVLLGQAMAVKPGDPEVMQRLAVLFEAEKMWPELLDNLRTQADAAPDAAARAQITRRIGSLLATELDDHEKALEAFREVLAVGYDEEAVRAVRELGESRDELRLEAASVLEPVLREAGRSEALVDVLELRLRAQTEPVERAATLRQIAGVAETSLSDLGRAQAALLRALAEEPQDASLHAEIERAAGLNGRAGWERYADALSERATSIFDAKVTGELFYRLGQVAERELGDLGRAAEAYARAAEQGGDTPEVLAALERVHAGREDTRALLDVVERRIAIESGAAEQADLYHRLASLQIEALGDKVQGLATLRLALERVPEHEKSRASVEELLGDPALFDDAFDTLEGVYRTTSRGADLGRLYARRVDRAEGVRGRTRARLELARVLEVEGQDAAGAQRAVEAAVLEDPQDESALAELERLAEANRSWPSAAEALAKALDTQERAARTESTRNVGSIAPGPSGQLWARLGQWRRDRVEDPRGAEIAFTRALESDPENIDLVRALDELTRAPGRERDRIAVLRRLVRLEGDLVAKRELSREAVAMAEDVLADPRLAEAVLRELLADNEADVWATEQLTRLREDAGDHAEVVTLLLRRAEGDGGEASALRHRAADVARTKLGDRDKAIALYEEILEQDPSDHVAQEQLRVLYEELGKYNELGKLLAMLVDNAGSAEQRGPLRLALAKLQLEKFEAPRDAADTLRAALEEDPDDDAAAVALGGIFEKLEQHAELAELWTQRVERARGRGDAALVLERQLVLADIIETRVKDPGAAMAVYGTILEVDPRHAGALGAVARLAEARGAWDKAAAALSTMLENAYAEEAVQLALRLARAREELGDDTGAAEALRRAVAASPRNLDVRQRLATLYEKTGSHAELAELLVGDADILAADHPYDPPPYVEPLPMRGSIAPGGIPGGSIAPPATAPPAVLQQVSLLRRAAGLLTAQGKAADAVPLLERVSRLLPQDRELMLLLVDGYVAAGRDRDAANVLERVIASYGNRRTKELAGIHHRLGKALAALGDRPEALAQLDMAFKIDPGSVEVLKDLGVLALESGDLERAQKTFRALLLQRLDASSGITKGEVFFYLGDILNRQGDRPKALQMLERAVENDPGLARARTLLAELKA